MNGKNLTYVLITSARNEEAYIQKTIKSVISQTILPKKWVIVSDGSTDRTDEIIEQYLKENGWIEFIRAPEHGERNFASKANCFNMGYQKVKDMQYDIIGNLDADISFKEDHFEFLMNKFGEMKELGVAGTAFEESSTLAYNYSFANIEHVSGQCQMFRKECFNEIGGYRPIKGGGVDWVAVTTARMNGWKTFTFPERTFVHHRKMGTGNNSTFMAWFKRGRKDYFLGNHPLWEVFRAVYQMTRKPYIMGGSFLFFGFAWAGLKGVNKPISKELIEFIRREQMGRLKAFFRRLIS